MSAIGRVPIAPEVLRWAIERTGLSESELASNPDFSRLKLWMNGKEQPTFKQAQKLAKVAGLPFGYLLLPAPVDTTPKLPDFRTDTSAPLSTPSKELEQKIYECQHSLDWYVDYANEYGYDHPELIGSASLSRSAVAAAENLRLKVGWDPTASLKRRKRINAVAELLEDQGLLVQKSSMVGLNTHARLDRNEFRGFTLIEEDFALIFINTADTDAANTFALAHELGHVILRKPGVCSAEERNETEHWCNAFAASFLAESENPNRTEQFPTSSTQMIHSYNAARERLGGNFLDCISAAYAAGSLSYTDAVRFTGYRSSSALHKALAI